MLRQLPSVMRGDPPGRVRPAADRGDRGGRGGRRAGGPCGRGTGPAGTRASRPDRTFRPTPWAVCPVGSLSTSDWRDAAGLDDADTLSCGSDPVLVDRAVEDRSATYRRGAQVRDVSPSCEQRFYAHFAGCRRATPIVVDGPVSPRPRGFGAVDGNRGTPARVARADDSAQHGRPGTGLRRPTSSVGRRRCHRFISRSRTRCRTRCGTDRCSTARSTACTTTRRAGSR